MPQTRADADNSLEEADSGLALIPLTLSLRSDEGSNGVYPAAVTGIHFGVRVVSEGALLQALVAALEGASRGASSPYAPPCNKRGYTCAAPGCERPGYSNGYCNAHYIRVKQGRPLGPPIRARKRESSCSVCGKSCTGKGAWGMCPVHYRATRYALLKDAAIQCFGGACSTCGGKFHRAAFDFHHRGEKKDSPSAMFANRSAQSIATELAKCELLCANCHRTHHADEYLLRRCDRAPSVA